MGIGVEENTRSWVVAACCCFCNLVFYGVSRLSGMMLVATTHSFHVSRASAAVPFSLSTAVRNLAGVFVGHLGHRFGVGPVVAAGCILASLGSCLCFFAKDMLWLTVCWGGVFGFGFGLCTCLLPLAINQNFSKHLGTASGISYSGSYIGSFIFPPAVVWLLETFALQGTFLIISGGVLNVLIAALLLKEPRKIQKKTSTISSMVADNPEKRSSEKPANSEQYYADVREMWKNNLHSAYQESQYSSLKENSCKQNYRHSISFANSPYCSQYPMHRENTPIRKCSYCNISLSEMNAYHCSQYSKSYSSLQNLIPKAQEYHKVPDAQNLPQSKLSTTSVSLKNLLHSTNVVGDCFVSKVNSNIESAKQAPMMLRGSFKKQFGCKSFFKSSLKAKYKLRLQKLKKVLMATFLKRRSPYLKELVQSENVKLTSFKYHQPFLYLNGSCISVPYENFHKPSSQNILRRGCLICRFNSNSKSPYFPIHRCDTKTRDRYLSLPLFPLNEYPVINDSLFEGTRYLVYSGKNHGKMTNTCSCNVSANKNQCHLCLLLPTSENKDCCSYHKGIPCSRDSDICRNTKNDDNIPYRNSLILSPESLLNEKTEFKAHRRKSSTNSHLKSPDSASDSCFLDWLGMFREPVFVIIGFTMSIQTFIVVSIVTTIEDYARDIGVPEHKTYYALMALSIANLFGTLTLGSITDRGLISRHRFMFLCFLGMSLSLAAVSVFAVSLPSLLLIVVLYGLLESGVIITFPLLTKQFIAGERRQAVAIASSNVLSVPTVMLVPMLIGHFRDHIGSYTGLFQLLGATSLTCSFLWLVTPSICKKRNSKTMQQDNSEI